MSETIRLNKQALGQLLIALIGHPHQIRELQATFNLAEIGLSENPIYTLMNDYRIQCICPTFPCKAVTAPCTTRTVGQ